MPHNIIHVELNLNTYYVAGWAAGASTIHNANTFAFRLHPNTATVKEMNGNYPTGRNKIFKMVSLLPIGSSLSIKKDHPWTP